MEKNACGIVSYAGLSREMLFSLGKAAFAQAQPPVPRRFDAFLPLFPVELIQNMDYVGLAEARTARVAPSGFSIDPVEYHKKLYTQLPELYEGDNYARNFDYEGRYVGRGVFTVDSAWVDHFPQYQPFMGEKLMIYLIGGGFQAVAVPESVYPRGGGVLEAAEAAMQITQRVELYNHYARARIATGDPYDADVFEPEFLSTTGLTATTLTQKEIGRVLQDLSIVKSLQSDTASVGLYTENARRAERVSQYVPMRYACDLFTPEAVDKHTARLAQLYNPDSDFVSDLWIPYQDVSAYMDRRTMTLNVRSLCEGYQIAPRYDPETRGGRYPDAVRVAVVRDRDLKLMVGEVINNPPYGDGMGPQGLIGKQVYIADSREMIRQRKLALEDVSIATDNTALPPEDYRKCLALAVLQEHKGRLVDAMYRRETALEQIDPDVPVYDKASALLNERVEKLSDIVKRESAQSGMSRMSGYDADIDYLRRKGRDREGVPEDTTGAKPIAFARDPKREQSIESGYAMRAGLLRMMYQDAALPEPPPEQTVGADDSEDEGNREHLPPIPPSVTTPPPPAAIQPQAEPPRDDEVSLDDRRKAKTGAAGKRPSQAEQASEAQVHTPGDSETQPPQPESAQAVQPNAVSAGASHPDMATDAQTAEPPIADQPTGGVPHGEPDATVPPEQAEGEPSAQRDEPQPMESDETVADEPTAGTDDAPLPDLEAVTDADPTDADVLPSDQEAATDDEPTDADVLPTGQEAATGDDSTDADAPLEQPTDADAAPEQPADETSTQPHRRVSLRELTDRRVGEPETPPATEPPAEPEKDEPPKPKLAFILRRGSEDAASKSYSRMSDLLHKRGQ